MLKTAIHCLGVAVVMLVLTAEVSVIALEAAPTLEHVRFFETNIRPVLVEHCWSCHGAKKQWAGLRLDSRKALLQGGDSGAAVVPGKAAESRLIRAIKHEDENLKMPENGKLSERQIADFVKWVELGAPFPNAQPSGERVDPAKHWAFQPIARPTVPQTASQTDVAPLDAFVLAKQRVAGVRSLNAADKRTLIRRATFDLTGLPPTPAEIDAFLKDESVESFNKIVDRLLASSAYGERWGRHWLDVARYADTAGDGADYPVREAFKYRDWVINSFNADQPFDEFIREQIAGDILAKAGPAEQYANRITATGFLAVGKRYGYAPNPDYQHLDFADAIDSIGRSLLGLSLGCARCHDHKYDPVSAQEYYGLYGILKSTQWAFPGGEEQKRPAFFPPLVPPEEAARLDQIKATELARLDGELARLNNDRAAINSNVIAGGIDLGFESQTLGKPPAGAWLSAGPNAVLAEAQSPFAHTHPVGTKGVRVGSGLKTDGVRYVFNPGLRAIAGKQMHFTIDFRVVAPAEQKGAFRFYLGRGVIGSTAVDISVTSNEVAVRSGGDWTVVRKIEPGTWYTLRLTIDRDKKSYSGIVGTPSDLTVINDKPLSASWDGVFDTFICDGTGHAEGPSPVRDLDNIGLLMTPFGEPGSGPVVAPKTPEDLPQQIAKLDAAIAATNKQRDAENAKQLYPVAYGVTEGTPTNVRIHKRGEPDKLGDDAPRGFVAILGDSKLPTDAKGSGRLELANWLTRPTNPLTARVFVNRVWQWHFGQGLVPTPSDFGTRGDAPTHPELLDWLTSEFIASGWKVKTLQRLIMSSRTYQLASDDDDANLRVDPNNVWLWRYSRRALDAESIRDSMLFVSGKLNRNVPAEHPFPSVDTWGFTIHRPFHAVYDSDHRSVYLMVQRNRRHPFLALFDAADPNLSIASRLPTTTPTQTLYLMNSPFVHDQANAMGVRILAAATDDAARVRWAVETTQGRVPSEAEVADAVSFVTAYQSKLAEQKMPTDRQPIVAWSALSRVLLTSNAFLYVD
ncbi:MAG: DUF1553 domain-containing protein [Planctomycetia bacterium]|nr:DUF1553 domain-containing protein [Planctomycetia bacterium]